MNHSTFSRAPNRVNRSSKLYSDPDFISKNGNGIRIVVIVNLGCFIVLLQLSLSTGL